ncbi:recombinase family protein [Patescibacteria group bacterium]|nr:recombinase family protein [Patescibacteria group bacterium]
MKNALIYCRVSTEEQVKEGYSLDAQEKFCAKFAENDDYRIVEVFRDEGKSATTLDRPALQDLLAKCQQDDSVDAVFVQETDRLARNTKDHLTIRAVLQKAGVKLVSVAQPMLDDSPEGNMIDTILASVNQFQSDLNSRKTKKGLQERFDQGWWPGWVPLGYLNVGVGGNADGRKAKKIIKKDPKRFDLIRKMFDMVLSGNYSVPQTHTIAVTE